MLRLIFLNGTPRFIDLSERRKLAIELVDIVTGLVYEAAKVLGHPRQLLGSAQGLFSAWS
jgi:hypothetical protein